MAGIGCTPRLDQPDTEPAETARYRPRRRSGLLAAFRLSELLARLGLPVEHGP